MNGLMMQHPLQIADILCHAERWHADSEIVSRNPEGGIHRYTYRDAARRARQAANVLTALGVSPQDRVATLAWNTHRHYELYYAVSGSGAILHTINPRLFPEQIVYILNHAEDRVLFIDAQFLPLIEAVCEQLKFLEHIVVLAPEAAMPDTPLGVQSYEALLADAPDTYDWPALDEDSAASLCYTSGTTGHPKGVLYSHRSTVLHAWACTGRDVLNVGNDRTLLPVVPMFHVNAWGVPYSATMAGAKLVLPGAGMDGASLYELIEGEQVDMLLGVPTVWLGLLQYCEKENLKLNPVRDVVIGGSAAPLSMIRDFDEKHDAFVIHAWGMTELSPVGTVNNNSRLMQQLPRAERYALQTKQGRPVFGVEMKIVDDQGQELPHDGKAWGRLLVRGPWIARGYYKHEDCSAWENGWFDTGDVATIDPHGLMQIVDRSKDVIKSGGEWISSIDLENCAMGHPAVAECAVIGVPHPKWDERPVLLVVLKEGQTATDTDLLDYLSGHVAKWQLPDKVLFVNELPHTPTGKLLKRALREAYQNLLME
ncbi:MAG: long-chain-fatty-acid--CoA ligase [Gammaproteobacteria bacterium]|nr:MAG: long-chain-fatty-acid--CoA ligase [Gammaproteobacteria bacterium]